MLLFQFVSLLIDFIYRFYFLKLGLKVTSKKLNLLGLHALSKFSSDMLRLVQSNKNGLILFLKPYWTLTHVASFHFGCC